MNNSKRNRFYSRLRNGKLEGGSLPRNHIFIEEKKEVWVLCESSISAMGIGAVMRRSFPDYKLCLCNRETFLRLGGKL
tara:strand:- start:39 stop:272 length:234 start_codon:yes stop_codon:yes gene_type:complete